MKKLIGLLSIITLLSSCSLFDRDPEMITIEGILYGEDGLTPVGAGVELDLYKEKTCITCDAAVVVETTTDENGYYKLEYESGEGSDLMFIRRGLTPILEEVPNRENLVRDLCLCNFGWVEVALSNNLNLASNDTLYFGIGVGGFSEPDIAFTQQNRNTTVTLKVEKDAFYGLSTRRYFYGVGKANYDYSWSGNTTPSGPPAPTEKSGWGTHKVNLAPYRTKLLLDF